MASRQLVDIIIKAEDQASAAARKVDESIRKIGESSSLLSRIPGFDTLKSKFSSLASTIDSKTGGAITRLRERFSSISSSVSSAAEGIKSKFSSAIDKVKTKISSMSESTKGLGNSFGFLKSALSMTVGMIGFDLFNALMESGRAAINAAGQLEYFANRLGLSQERISEFNSHLDDMQKQFRKVNMRAVGAAAEEMAVKLKLPQESLEELTKATAVMSSAFVKEGRTQEDAILAVSDALDGQFRRLQELGITQDMLKNNGWNGDLQDKQSLLEALNKTLDEMGFTETAQDITSLDDAFQALSVAGGDLLASILIPLTPILIGIMEVVIGVADAIKGFAGGLMAAFSGLPEWAQIAIGIGLVAVAVGILIPAFGGLGAIASAITGPLFAVAGAMLAIEWPIVAVVAAIALVVAAIYELGKAFGWWTDVSSMLEAIWAGLQRLWSAFINHPDVQAVIKAIGDAWNWVVSGIQWVINAIMEFFGVATGGEFDIVRAIIDGIGLAWQWLSLPIRYVVMVVQAAVSAFQWLWQVLEPVGQFLLSIMVPVWTMVADILGQVIGYVMSVIEVFGQLLDGTANLGDVFNTVWGGLVELMSGVAETIWNTIVTVITNIATGIVEFVTNMLVWSLQAGWNFVTGLVTWLSQLPGKVLTFLIQVATNIMVQTARWVMTAKQKAMELVTNVVNFIRQLPGRILSLLMQVLSNIINAGRQWVTNAKNKAKEVVDGAVNTIKQLPDKIAQAVAGVVDAIVKPFRDAYNQAKSWWDRITSLGTGGWGGDEAWGGDDSAWGGDDTAWGGDSSIYKGLIKTPHGAYIKQEALDVNYNHKLTLSFEDVPPHMSEETLVKLLSRKNVLKSITENPDFQNLDAEMKRKAIDRINRARGV